MDIKETIGEGRGDFMSDPLSW